MSTIPDPLTESQLEGETEKKTKKKFSFQSFAVFAIIPFIHSFIHFFIATNVKRIRRYICYD